MKKMYMDINIAKKVKAYKKKEKWIRIIYFPTIIVPILYSFINAYVIKISESFVSGIVFVFTSVNILAIHDWLYLKKEIIRDIRNSIDSGLEVEGVSDKVEVNSIDDIKIIPVNLKVSEDLTSNNQIVNTNNGHYIVAGVSSDKQIVLREFDNFNDETYLMEKEDLELIAHDFELSDDDIENIKTYDEIKRLVLK